MSEQILRIEKLANGYTVEVTDPAVAKRNKNSKLPYESPWKEYAFSSSKEVKTFVSKVLDKLTPVEDDMATNFDRAVSEDD
jgi:hypothetical protein